MKIRHRPLERLVLSRRALLWTTSAAALAVLVPSPALAGPTPPADPFRLRPPGALGGSDLASLLCDLPDADRYQALGDAVLEGNVPEFMRALVPVPLDEAGRAVVFVTRDYLAVGTDDDPLRVPVDYATAARVAREAGCLLPTPRIVDAIWRAADIRLVPDPMPPSDLMRSMAYVQEHDDRIREALGGSPDALVAGHKKDVVLSVRLRERRNRVAIYGWHQPDGVPIQPVSVWHGVGYADYSHGIRLVARHALLDGAPVDLRDALADPGRSALFSDEGPLDDVDRLMNPAPGAPT